MDLSQTPEAHSNETREKNCDVTSAPSGIITCSATTCSHVIPLDTMYMQTPRTTACYVSRRGDGTFVIFVIVYWTRCSCQPLKTFATTENSWMTQLLHKCNSFTLNEPRGFLKHMIRKGRIIHKGVCDSLP